MSRRNPWFKFHPQDWLTDVELRACSSAARGTLMDLMCIAHNSEEYGVCMPDLQTSTRKRVAKHLALTLRTLDSHLTILIQMHRICMTGVEQMSDICQTGVGQVSDRCRTDAGHLYVKRMVKDHAFSSKQSEKGVKGAAQRLKPEQNRTDKEQNRTDIGKTASPKSFKQWSESDLRKSMAENDGILSADDAAAFFDYWSEPTSKGRLALSLKPTWDTRRRMQTWARNNEKRGNRNTGGDTFVSSLPK